MIVLDFSLVLQILLFLLLWLVLNKLLFKPYMALMDQREHHTAGTEEESAALEHEAERLRIQYEEELAKATAAGNTIKDALVQEARQYRETLLSQARAEASRTLEAARLEIDRQLAQERRLAAHEAETVAREMVSKVLGRSIG